MIPMSAWFQPSLFPAFGALLALGSVDAAPVSIQTSATYHGWSDAVILSNGRVEAVLVPSVGRWMQFRRAGANNGPFWENPSLAGKSMPAKPWEASHGSFGGDKTWPAPQSAWNWPPPDVFDATPLSFRVPGDGSVVLASSVSPRYGIRTERRFSLQSGSDTVEVTTTYEKVQGPPVEAGGRAGTQNHDPLGGFLSLPKEAR